MASEYEVTLGNGIRVPRLASDPSSGARAGDIYFNTTSNKFRGYDGTAWADIGAGGGMSVVLDENLEALDYITLGAGAFANVRIGNKDAKAHIGQGASQTGTMLMMFRYRTGMSEIKVWVRREGAANSLLMSLVKDGVLDSSISGSSIIATANNTWEEKTLTIGSTYSNGDHLEIEINSTVDAVEANFVSGIWIK